MKEHLASRAPVIHLVCSLVAFGALTSLTQASTLAAWGPSSALVSSTQTSPRWVEITPESPSLPLHLGIPLTPASRYSGPSIYGGIKVTGQLRPSAFRFFNNHPAFGGGNDVIDIRIEDPNPSEGGRVTTLLLWRNEAPASTDGERYLQRLSYTGGYSQGRGSEAYFVLRVIDSPGPQPSYAYLISPVSITNVYTATHERDASRIPWFAYDPGSNGETLDLITDLSETQPLFQRAFIPVSRITHAGLLFQGGGRSTSSVLAISAFAAHHVSQPVSPSP
jgi:hypothetical protein